MTRTPPLRRVAAVLGALALGAGMAAGSVALAAPAANLELGQPDRRPGQR